jgi:hypothetical protein
MREMIKINGMATRFLLFKKKSAIATERFEVYMFRLLRFAQKISCIIRNIGWRFFI